MSDFLDQVFGVMNAVAAIEPEKPVKKAAKTHGRNRAGLMPKQELFAQLVSRGVGIGRAYLTAGYKKSSSYAVSASVLLKTPKVQQRLEELRSRVERKHEITREKLLDDLLETREVALSADPPQASAAVAATMAIGKLTGIDRQQLDIILHRPGFTSKMLELDEGEWSRQFDPAEQPQIAPIGSVPRPKRLKNKG